MDKLQISKEINKLIKTKNIWEKIKIYFKIIEEKYISIKTNAVESICWDRLSGAGHLYKNYE